MDLGLRGCNFVIVGGTTGSLVDEGSETASGAVADDENGGGDVVNFPSKGWQADHRWAARVPRRDLSRGTIEWPLGERVLHGAASGSALELNYPSRQRVPVRVGTTHVRAHHHCGVSSRFARCIRLDGVVRIDVSRRTGETSS